MLAVMAVLIGVAITTLRFDRSEQRIADELYRFTQFYRGARDQALLSGTPMRLSSDQQRLILQQRQYGEWQNTDSDLQLSETLKWQFSPTPPIYLFPSGQSTPFRVQVFLLNEQTQRHDKLTRLISGDAVGRLTMSTP